MARAPSPTVTHRDPAGRRQADTLTRTTARIAGDQQPPRRRAPQACRRPAPQARKDLPSCRASPEPARARRHAGHPPSQVRATDPDTAVPRHVLPTVATAEATPPETQHSHTAAQTRPAQHVSPPPTHEHSAAPASGVPHRRCRRDTALPRATSQPQPPRARPVREACPPHTAQQAAAPPVAGAYSAGIAVARARHARRRANPPPLPATPRLRQSRRQRPDLSATPSY